MLDHLKLQQKIFLGYSLPIIALLGATIWGAISTQNIVKQFQQISVISELTDKTHHLQLAHLQMSNGVRGYLIQPKQIFLDADTAGEEFLQETINALQEERFQIDHLSQHLPPDQLQEMAVFIEQLDRLILLISAYDTTSNQFVSLSQNGQREQANQLFDQQSGEEINQEFSLLNDQLHKIYESLVMQDTGNVEQLLNQLLYGLIVLAIGMGGLSALVLWWIGSRLTQTLNTTVEQITSSTHEIMATVEQQTSTTAKQASSVHQTTTTIEELERSAQLSAEQAHKASQSATQALTLANRGNQSVEETLTGMEILQTKVEAIAAKTLRLSEQNQQIGTISKVVSTLSNQTNMLALNAAVEAVRAGEYGKGFSVVASEIRKLADESQKSAEQINHLVSEIQATVNSTVSATQEGTVTVTNGMELAKGTAQVFSGVQDAVNDVVMNNQQITLNVQQQVQAVRQIVEAMDSLNQGAQETTQGTRQTQHEIQKLDQSAQALKALV